MTQIQLKQNADFLSIAIESLDTGSGEVADEFIDDVADSLEDSTLVDKLRESQERISEGKTDEAADIAGEVYESLLDKIENL